MKKAILIITSIYLLIFCFAANAVENTYEYKLGTAYATDPKKWGWQVNFEYYYEFDPYIVVGLEPGIYWLNWEKKVGEEQQGMGVTADVKADSNAYMIPLMVNGQIRLPNLRNKLYFLPHITLGLGYSFMIYNYKQPKYTDLSDQEISAKNETKLYTGLTWQCLVGGTFRPGQESNIGFVIETGYRGAKVQKGNLEINMSSFIINVGVRYPFGGARGNGVSI